MERGRGIFWVLLGACAFVLSATLAIFPTLLNPGLPLLLSGCLGVLVALARALFGTGAFYRPSGDLVLVLLGWMAISTLFTVDTELSFRSLASFAGGAAFFAACQVGISSRRQWRAAAYTLLVVCAGASLQAWVSAIGQARATGVLGRLQGTFVNPDTFSVLPLLGLCLVFGLVERAGPKATWINLGLAGLFLATILGTGCRSSIAGLLVGAVFFMATLFRFRGEKAEKTKVFVGFPLILALLFLPIMGLESAFSHKWTRMLETEAADTEQIRLELLQHGWKAVVKEPLLGSGPGTFGLSYQTVRPPHDEMYINIAHNDFLEVAVETGLSGFALWLALTWLAVSRLVPLIRSGRRPTEAAATGAAVLALATYSLFNFIIVQRPVLWAQLWLLGLAYSFPSARLEIRESKPIRFLSSGALLVAALWSARFGYQTLKTDEFAVLAARAEKELRLEQADTLYSSALALQPWRSSLWVDRAKVLSQIQALQGQEEPKARLEALLQAHQHSPHDIRILLSLAEAQREAGLLEEARASLDQAYSLTPYRGDVFDSRLAFLIRQNDLQGAAEALADWTYSRPTYDGKFVTLLYLLESRQPGAGVKVAGAWLEHHQDERGFSLVEQAVARAAQNKDWEVQERFLLYLKKLRPNDLCLDLALARSRGARLGPQSEFDALESARANAQEKLDPCFEKLLQRWSNLGLQLKKGREVESALRQHLSLSPRQSWARVLLAGLLRGEKRFQEAARPLREGLELSPNEVELILALAEVFEAQGSKDLALSYYREAARLSPEDRRAQGKIKALLRTR